MLFTVTVDMADHGYFEFSTESLFKLVELAQMLGNSDIVDDEDEDEDFEDDDFMEIPEEIAKFFEDSEEYVYDEDKDVFCWYDEQHEAWYYLNIETGEWLLVEDADGFEVEDSEAV
jgi:UDP-N-acetylglucosamine pyrophosphorylase